MALCEQPLAGVVRCVSYAQGKYGSLVGLKSLFTPKLY